MIDAPLYDGELDFNVSLRTMAVVQDQHRTPERLEMKSTSISSEGPHSLSTLAPQEHWVAVEVKQEPSILAESRWRFASAEWLLTVSGVR